MKGAWFFSAHVVVIGVVLFVPRSVPAQVPSWDFSISGFGGAAIPFGTDIQESIPTFLKARLKHVEFDSSASFGGKVCAWTTTARPTTALDFGAEFDITHFSPDVEARRVRVSATRNSVLGNTSEISVLSANLSTTIAAVNLLARWPIGVSERLPHGRVYPYLGVGAGAQITNFKISDSNADDTDIARVLQFLAGLKVFLRPNVALFAEYKFSRAEHTFQLDTDLGTTKEEVGLNAHHVVGGFAIHFSTGKMRR